MSLQSATEQTVAVLEIFAAHHYNMVTKIILLFISPLNSEHNFQIFSKFCSHSTTKKIIGTLFSSVKRPGAGADPGFFLGGGALVSCSTSTPINHIVFFFFFLQNTSCIRKPQVISGGGGGGAPPAPSL